MDINSKAIIIVKDFSAESIPLYYTREIDGGRIIYCSECGKLVLADKPNTHYCKKCSKEKELEQKRISAKKARA